MKSRPKLLAVLVLIFNISLISMLNAATISVPSDVATVKEAFELAESGDTVFLESGTHTLDGIENTDLPSIHLQGASTKSTVLTFSKNFIVPNGGRFKISQLTMQPSYLNLPWPGFPAWGPGSFNSWGDGQLEILDCVFLRFHFPCSASQRNSADVPENPVVTIRNTSFIEVGLACNLYNVPFEIESCTFKKVSMGVQFYAGRQFDSKISGCLFEDTLDVVDGWASNASLLFQGNIVRNSGAQEYDRSQISIWLGNIRSLIVKENVFSHQSIALALEYLDTDRVLIKNNSFVDNYISVRVRSLIDLTENYWGHPNGPMLVYNNPPSQLPYPTTQDNVIYVWGQWATGIEPLYVPWLAEAPANNGLNSDDDDPLPSGIGR